MSGSSTRSPPTADQPGGSPRCCASRPAVLGGRRDTVKATTGTPTGRRLRLYGGEGAERAGRGAVDADVGAGDRGHPAAEGLDQQPRGAARWRRTLTVARRCGATGLVVVRVDSAFYNADVVAASAGAVPGSPSPPADAAVLPRSPASPNGPGPRSTTRTRSGTRPAAGSPTPRSPKPATPRSPPPQGPAGDRPADRAPGQTAQRPPGQDELVTGTVTTRCSPTHR